MAQSIRITEHNIPDNAIRGDQVILECLYDLQGRVWNEVFFYFLERFLEPLLRGRVIFLATYEVNNTPI